MLTFSVNIEDNASPEVEALIRHMTNRQPLHAKIGKDLQAFIRRYVIKDHPRRHKTSSALGAPSSDFVKKAIEAVESAPVESDAQKTTVLLPHPWFARAFGDVSISPTGGRQYLTIPLIAEAYGENAPKVPGLFFFEASTGKNFLAQSINTGRGKGTLELWYLLVEFVFQEQDRSRLPSDAEIMACATDSAERFLERTVKDARARRNN